MTAWGELAKAHAADGGAGLAILSESFASPTLARLAAELRARYPKLQWATYDAVSDESRIAGLRPPPAATSTSCSGSIERRSSWPSTPTRS